MLRTSFIVATLYALAACASTPADHTTARLSANTAQASLEKDIDIYTTYAVAKYAGLTEEHDLSADQFKKLLKDVRTEPWIAEQAVFSVLRLGDIESALEIANSLEPDTLSETELPRLTLAVAALKAGDDIETLTQLGTTWHSSFHAMLARSLAAWAALDADPDAAISIQSKASPNGGTYTLLSHTLAALMKASIGREDAALEDLETLWYPSANAMGVEAYARLSALSGDTARATDIIDIFYQSGRHHPAITALESEIDAGLVTPFTPLTKTEGAARVLYLITVPQATAAYGDIAAVYFTLANYLDPDYYAIQTQWAHTLDSAGRRSDAIDILHSIPAESLHHSIAQSQLAWALFRDQRDDEALALARATLEHSEDRQVRIQLANLLQQFERDGEAEATYTKIIDADEADGVYDWRIYLFRGQARERLGVWPLAESDLQTALALNPDSPTVLNYLGYSWIDRGLNLDKGLELVEYALEQAPENGAITDSLGWAHYKLGNFEQAILYLERATELAPDVAEILDHLGDAYWQVGRFKEAGFQWQRALRFSHDDDERVRIEQKLATGLTIQSAAATLIQPTYP